MSRADREVADSVAQSLRNQARRAGWALDPAGWARDVLGVHMWSKQLEIAQSVVDNKKTVVASCHGTGKALDVNTLIPVPGGTFLPMGDVKPGIEVFGADGRPVTVLAATGVHEADRYRVILASPEGEREVIASGDHLWPVLGTRDRSRAQVAAERAGIPEVHLGLWHHLARNLTTRELHAQVRARQRYTVPGRIPVLRQAAWKPPRWVTDLLTERGVGDESGRPALQWTGRNAEQPAELTEVRNALSRAKIRTLLHRRKNGQSTAVWTLTILTDAAISLLPDETMRATAGGVALHREVDTYDPGPAGWSIVAVEEVPAGDVQCIQVDAPDSLYLCTEDGIPTHNSMIASVIACWWVSTRPPGEAIVVSTAPTYAQVNKILWEEIRKHHGNARIRGFPMLGRVTQGDEWKSDTGQVVAFGRKPATGDRHGFQGIHRRHVLAIGDEACHDDQTDVLTEQGWKRFKDVQPEDRLLCMDKDTHQAYYEQPVRLIDKAYSGDMAVYDGKGLNYSVTPDHTMLYAQRKKDATLSWRTREHQAMTTWYDKAVKRTIDWNGADNPELSDDWLEFLGWFGAAGTITPESRRIRVHQSKAKSPENWQAIRDVTARLGWEALEYGHGFVINNQDLAEQLAPWGETRQGRRVPDFVRLASARQIWVYLDAFSRSAGYDKKQGRVNIYTTQRQMADDLQEMILKIGLPSVVVLRPLVHQWVNSPDGGFDTVPAYAYIVTLPKRGAELTWPRLRNLRTEHYEGRVYCATMRRDHLLFTRRNGYTMWSGNCGLPEEIWTGIEAITTNEGCRQLYIGNPDDRNTEFGRVFLRPDLADDWNRISVPASSTPNFTGEEVPPILREVLVSRQWCEERKRDWGVEDPRYTSKVEATFPEVSKSSLFPPSVVSSAFDEIPPQMQGGVVRLGVDVARFGSDSTVVVSYAGRTARVEDEWTGTDTTSSAHQVIHLAEEIKERLKASWVEIRVDAVGLGAGVVDTLNARLALTKTPWFSVFEMHGSASPPNDVGGSVQGYGNARAYWFDQLRQGMKNTQICIEEHTGLKDDLAMIFYGFRNGKLFIASKEEMRSKHGKSPDYADALTYATAPIAVGMEIGDTVTQSPHDMLNSLSDFEEENEMSISPY